MVFEYCDQVGSNVYSVRFYELIFTVCMSFCQDLKKYFDSLATAINPKTVQVCTV